MSNNQKLANSSLAGSTTNANVNENGSFDDIFSFTFILKIIFFQFQFLNLNKQKEEKSKLKRSLSNKNLRDSKQKTVDIKPATSIDILPSIKKPISNLKRNFF